MRLRITRADEANSRQEGKWTYYRLSEAGRDKAVGLLLAITAPNAGQEGICPLCDK